MRVFVTVLLLFGVVGLHAQEFGPWKFGMSAEQIKEESAFAPYNSFSNGDLETYKGMFAGRPRNFQFYLLDGKLSRISIRVYEGTDMALASQAWSETYVALSSIFGDIETPRIAAKSLDRVTEESRALVEAGSKAQMAPIMQHDSQFVFATFMHGAFGNTSYMVTVNIDKPRKPSP